jgi:ParB family chromosome partitioning protein
MGHARALLGLESDAEIERAAREATRKGWSVRQTEETVARRRPDAAVDEKTPRAPKNRGAGESAAERDVRERLQRALGTKVELSHQGGKGTLTIHFDSYDALQSVLERLGA